MRTRIRELTLALKYGHAALDDAEIKRLYTVERWTLERIAELYGCHFSAIGYRLKLMGVPRRPVGRRKAAECFCGKPAAEKAGAKCAFHRRVAMATASRNHKRRKFRIPRERWLVVYDVQPRKTRKDKGTGMSGDQMRAYKTGKQREYRRASA